MLAVEGLVKEWPDFRLEIGLEVSDGEIVALLGPSGCGKSSFLRILAGLEVQDAGSIRLGGKALDRVPPEKRGIGMVFQDFALFPAMSVRRNIEYGPRMRGIPRGLRESRAEALASAMEIGGLLGRHPDSLSGGEQQRVALARCLAAQPALVLLDEPLSSLDAGLRRRLRSEIVERLRAAGVMAIHVTHDVEEALAVADRVFLMARGIIVESGAPEALYARPATAYGARFLGRGPLLPLLGLRGGEGVAIAVTALGEFALAGPFSTRPEGRLSLFFPAEAPNHHASSAPDAGANVIEGIVIESSFAGRFRRVEMLCEPRSGGHAGPIAIEIELPPSLRPARGDRLRLRVRPEDCMLLPELA